MRETALEGPEAGRITLRTDDRGTTITGADDIVIEEHGTDRHAEAIERWQAEGWRVVADGDVRPAIAAPSDGGTSGVADGQGPAATVTDGASS